MFRRMACLTLALMLLLVAAPMAAAAVPTDAPTEVWVNPAWIGVDSTQVDGHTIGTDAFATIQKAIDALPNTGGTVHVADGEYLLNQQIRVTKNISIIGAGKDATIIRASADFLVPGDYWADANAMVLVDEGKIIALRGITLDGNYRLDGTGKTVVIGILSHGSGTISNCAFTNIVNPPPAYDGVAIALHGGDMTIEDNTFTNIGRIGVYTGFGSEGTMTGNTYTGKGVGDWLDYAFEVGRDGKATISDKNTITDCTGVASVDSSSSAGILVTTYYGTAEATITGNTITDCTTAVAVGYDADDTSVVAIHENNLDGNIEDGVTNTSSTNAVDARCNWWGVSDSSAIAALTDGAVNYDLWYTDAAMTNLASAKQVVNTTRRTSHDTIQAAISAAGEGDTIVVSAGTYAEDLTIAKSLTLKGAQAGQDPTMVAPSDVNETILKGAVALDAGNVTLDGFAFVDDQIGRDFIALYLKGVGDYTVRNCVFTRDTGRDSAGLAAEASRVKLRAIHIGPASCSATIENNLFTGSAANVYRNSSWRSGIWCDGVGVEDSVTIRNNVFNTNRAALNLDNKVDNITLTGNRFLNNGTHISLGGSPLLVGSLTISGNKFSRAGTVFNLSGVAESFRLDARDNTYDLTAFDSTAGAKAPSGMSLDERFLLESTMVHKMATVGKQGLVRLLTGEILVGQGGTIQQAINVADSGDVIRVAAGTYSENVAFPAAKERITLQGAVNTDGTLLTTICGAPGASGYTLTLAGPSSTVKDLVIDQAPDSTNGIGIAWGWEAIGSTLTGCTVRGHLTGVYLSSNVDDAAITDNLITGNANGILIEGVLNDTDISENTISDNTWNDDYWKKLAKPANAGIRVLANYGGAGNTITRNIITGSAAGVHNASVTSIAVPGNYWGKSAKSEIDPQMFGPVNYDPWYSDATMTSLVSTRSVLNTTQATSYDSVQAAINGADNDDVIQVAAGTYTGALSITKPVTIKGAGSGQTVIKPSALLDTNIGHKYDVDMQVAVLVDGANGAHLQDMTIDAGGLAANAVVLWNASRGSLDQVTVTNTGWVVNGMQTGQGIAVDAGKDITTVLDINGCQISGFNKNAVDAVNGNGATSDGGRITVNVSGGTITGLGATDKIAQNGILFWERAGGTVGGSIDGATITGLNYTPSSDRASGVLLYAIRNGAVSVIDTNFSSTNEAAVSLHGGTTVVLDARHNYWGKSTGPDVTVDIAGADSASRIAYSPWWTNASMTTEGYLTSGSIVINDGNSATTSTAVSLAITSDSATKCAVSQSATFSDNPAWRSIVDGKLTTAYTLSGSYGAKTVYVKFEDAIGNQWIACDSITYEAPAGTGGGGTPFTPPASPPIIAGSTSEVITTAGGTVNHEDTVVVTFPANAISADVTVTIAPVVENVPPTTGMVMIGDHVYDITAETADGTEITTFAAPVTIAITLTDADLAEILAAGGTPHLHFWDDEHDRWIALPTMLNGNVLTATTSHFTTFAVAINSQLPNLKDIKGNWAEGYILRLAGLGIAGGNPDGTFAPKANLTRTEAAKMLANALGLQADETFALTFDDAASIPAWGRGYVAAVVKAGLMKGDNNLFRPTGTVTRAEFAVMVARALNLAIDATALTAFTDDAQLPAWAKAHIVAAVKAGIIDGLPGNLFGASQACNREQAAKMLCKLIDLLQ